MTDLAMQTGRGRVIVSHEKSKLNSSGMYDVTGTWIIIFSPALKNQIRKSKDYVYGKWVFKALGIWKGY